MAPMLFSTAIWANILTDENLNGFLTINDLDLAEYIAYLHLFAPRMAPLKHISTGVDNTAEESWARRGSVSTATAIGPLRRSRLDNPSSEYPCVHQAHPRSRKH